MQFDPVIAGDCELSVSGSGVGYRRKRRFIVDARDGNAANVPRASLTRVVVEAQLRLIQASARHIAELLEPPHVFERGFITGSALSVAQIGQGIRALDQIRFEL